MILKRIIEKVVVLEGGRGVKCVVKREGGGGGGQQCWCETFACSAVPFWMRLVSGDASILTYVSVAAASSAWRSLATGGGGVEWSSQPRSCCPSIKKKKQRKKKPPPPSSPHVSMQE